MTETNREAVQAQLARMANSRVFAQAGRMFPLLEYLVDAELGERPHRCVQRTIAIEVFGREEEFDPSVDAIVRVEVGRLRNKLREYYATDGSADRLLVDVPRGQYRARIRKRNDPGYAYPGSMPEQTKGYCRTRDGVSLAYSTIGDGYPLVTLPHWLSHLEADVGNPLIQHYWIELSRRFRLVRYDTRGFGLSDRDVPDFPFDALVTDLETVVDALGLETFALLGPSGGASVGTAYAARHPERVSHLMLLGGFIRGPRRTGDPFAVDYADAIEVLIRIGWGDPHSRFRKVFCSMLVPDGTPEQYQWMDDVQLAAASGENAERYFKILSNFDLSEECARIQAPALVFHGAEETGVPLKEAEYAVSRIPKARLVPLPTKNHLLVPDEPAWPLFLQALDEFFAAAASTPKAIRKRA